MSTERAAWVVAALLALAAVACRPRSCVELVRAGDVARATERCAAGDAAAVAAAARGPAAGALLRLAGRLELEAGRADAARPALEEALRLARAAGDARATFEAAELLARAHWERTDFPAALGLAEAARDAAATTGDRVLVARSLLSLGTVLATVGDTARALEVLGRAEAALPPDDRAGRARVLIDRAGLLDEQGQGGLSTALLEEARRLAIDVGADRLVIAAELNLAHRALVERRLDDAARHLDAARERRRAAGITTPSEALWLGSALLARLRGDLDGAARILDDAERLELPPDVSWMVAQQRGRIAEARGAPDAAEREYRRAIAVIEELRAAAPPVEVRAAFLEERWGPYGDLFALLLERDRVAAALEVVALAQGRMFLDTLAVNAVERAGAVGRLAELASLRPALARSPLATPAVGRDALLGRHVLVYFAGRDVMRLVVLRDGRAERTAVAVPLDELAGLVDAFRARRDDPALAATLGERLLPEGSLPAPGTRVELLVTGPLARLPFAALLVGGRRLVERHELVHLPSLAAPRNAPAAGGPAVILADARLDLRHAPAELAAVVAATGAAAHVGRDATRAALRAAAGAALLHVAGHSGVDAGGGYLVLADGDVGAADVVRWGVGPALVVLPTCASAASHRGELWGSLASAFLAAGSRHVVATLASVEDADAAEFVTRFYALGGRVDPVGATGRAQRAMAATHPVSTWSAFVVAGL